MPSYYYLTQYQIHKHCHDPLLFILDVSFFLAYTALILLHHVIKGYCQINS